MKTLPDLLRSFCSASAFRRDARASPLTGAAFDGQLALAEVTYSAAAGELTAAVAGLPGDGDTLYEALVVAWREAMRAEPSAEESDLCRGVVLGAFVWRSRTLDASSPAVSVVSTDKPRGDA